MIRFLALGALFMAWLATEIVVFSRDRQKGSGKRGDGGSRPFVLLLIGIGIALCLITLVRPVLPLGGHWAWWLVAGALLWLAGTLIRQRAVRWLGTYFRTKVTILEDHRLITDGPYARLRHPSYTGGLLACAGVGLAFGDGAALLAMTLLPLAGLAYRIAIEERALANAFGAEWIVYRDRTAALIPGLW